MSPINCDVAVLWGSEKGVSLDGIHNFFIYLRKWRQMPMSCGSWSQQKQQLQFRSYLQEARCIARQIESRVALWVLSEASPASLWNYFFVAASWSFWYHTIDLQNELRRVSPEEDPDRFSRWAWGEVVEWVNFFVAARRLPAGPCSCTTLNVIEKSSQAKGWSNAFITLSDSWNSCPDISNKAQAHFV